jgi:hypothetical protein
MPERRAAQNQLLFRRLNEQIHKVDGNSSAGTLDAVCECGDERCFAHISLPVVAYLEVRKHPHRFVVAPGHESSDSDIVIGKGEGFVVVDKPETLVVSLPSVF